jgi:hypothetical protein
MEVLLFLILVNSLVFAGICASVSGLKRKNSGKWLILGFLFGVVALLVLIGSPSETSASSAS